MDVASNINILIDLKFYISIDNIRLLSVIIQFVLI